MVFPWEAKVECVAEIVKNLITTFVISNAKTVKTVNGDADNFNSTQAFIDTFGLRPKNFLEKGNIGRKTKLGFYWELTKELVVADKILVITKGFRGTPEVDVFRIPLLNEYNKLFASLK